MDESPYDSELLLQELLAHHPDLLAGEQMNGDAPRRWLLVTREMAVPDSEQGSGKWSLDHLFIDQDAVPTLVEVKRSSDLRIRREVVGQMLDYAANAVAYWPIEQIRTRFELRCEAEGAEPDEMLEEFLGESDDPESFWKRVKTNLQAGRVRLVFLADVIPSELRRVVEFLNGQMDPAEVLAIEVKQFVGSGMKTIVPRLLGQTETARQKKASSTQPSRQWDATSFLERLRERRGDDPVDVARKCLEWAHERELYIWWGRGAVDGAFIPSLRDEHGKSILFGVWTYGRLELQFQHMNRRPFRDIARRRELADRLQQIPGIDIPDDRLTKRPTFDLAVLQEPDALQTFFNAFDWMLAESRNTTFAQ
ncbi:hypothetical protein Mal4_11570 [Maioricimonas rarisocia]|uniref:DUF4268 domain-containing protein n=2 Tax=Maioricimonas rarisocia TaxID=2528026 RepID=A0A517Z358_9PLAN|nr:hypothetical protein Mal4_11570 [Maioricimonas rarisocia]